MAGRKGKGGVGVGVTSTPRWAAARNASARRGLCTVGRRELGAPPRAAAPAQTLAHAHERRPGQLASEPHEHISAGDYKGPATAAGPAPRRARGPRRAAADAYGGEGMNKAGRAAGRGGRPQASGGVRIEVLGVSRNQKLAPRAGSLRAPRRAGPVALRRRAAGRRAARRRRAGAAAARRRRVTRPGDATASLGLRRDEPQRVLAGPNDADLCVGDHVQRDGLDDVIGDEWARS
jgi:hypothetical protein